MTRRLKYTLIVIAAAFFGGAIAFSVYGAKHALAQRSFYNNRVSAEADILAITSAKRYVPDGPPRYYLTYTAHILFAGREHRLAAHTDDKQGGKIKVIYDATNPEYVIRADDRETYWELALADGAPFSGALGLFIAAVCCAVFGAIPAMTVLSERKTKRGRSGAKPG